MTHTFDSARRAYPLAGLAVYAYEPGGEVTLEVHSAVGIRTFVGPTLDACLAAAFPVLPEAEAADEPDIFAPAAPPPVPAPSIFG